MKKIIKSSFFLVLLMGLFSIGLGNAYAKSKKTNKFKKKTESVLLVHPKSQIIELIPIYIADPYGSLPEMEINTNSIFVSSSFLLNNKLSTVRGCTLTFSVGINFFVFSFSVNYSIPCSKALRIEGQSLLNGYPYNHTWMN